MFCCCCFLGSASFFFAAAARIYSNLFNKSRRGKRLPLHTVAIEKVVSREENGPHSKDGSVHEIHTVVIQGLLVCLFLLNYFSFKNMETESVKSTYFVQ